MKTLFKTPIFFLALSVISFGAFAQSNSGASAPASGPIYSIGVESGISTGNFRDVSRWNIGGSIQADIPVASQLYFTANAGYLNFKGKDNIGGTIFNAPDIHLLPVMAGLKYFPVSNFYIQGDAGAGFALNKSDVGYNKTAAFLYAPQIGVQFNVGGKNYIDAGVRYEGTTKYLSSDANSKINFIGIRIAYGFGTK